MHNTDRILNERDYEYGFLNESEMGYEGPYAQEGPFDGEWEWENGADGEWEWESSPSAFSQEMEYALASELLGVNNEEELEQFLSSLVRRAARGVANFARSPVGKSLVSGLKSVAKTALPIAGKAAGSFFGGPIGGIIGGKLGAMAANLFEMNLEGMSNEDREFEVARRVVRLSGAATRNAVSQVKSGLTRRVPPVRVAANALKSAAVKHAPGLLTPVGIRPSQGNVRPPAFWSAAVATPSPPSGGSFSYSNGGDLSGGGVEDSTQGAASGTWVRQGDQIILTL